MDEINFVVQKGDQLIPIEVKSNENLRFICNNNFFFIVSLMHIN
jgi:hypothetical protein